MFRRCSTARRRNRRGHPAQRTGTLSSCPVTGEAVCGDSDGPRG
ncbi:50S ribosomal protein L32 [Lentzea albida]